MELLIRSAKIIDPASPFHNQIKDIHIVGGRIKKIGSKLPKPSSAKEFAAENLHVSIGWFDLNTFLAEPGFEQKETIETGCRAAAAGGYTNICCLPNTEPVLQTKEAVEYVLNKSKNNLVTIHPFAAITRNTEGKDLTDLYDLHTAGAVAFSDGFHPLQNAGIMQRGLEYMKGFGGIIFNQPEDKSIAKNGVMNEGITSTQMGLPSAPALAEELAVVRDIYLLEYTESRLHLLGISLKKSVEFIRLAKKKGLRLSASANAYNLLLDESSVSDYNTFYKLNPHLRTKEDINGLIKGISDGTIDTITSAHNPQDEECKNLEFDKADFGMIGLETCFAVANTVLNGKITIEQLIALFTINPRKILGITAPIINEGESVDMTLFNPSLKWIFKEANIHSKSKNTPFVGHSFIGKPLGVVNKGIVVLNK